jgi:MerR family transcriptional regulator, heat shock protein HspR
MAGGCSGLARPPTGRIRHLHRSRTLGAAPTNPRVYEREGLIDPERSVGGTRRYSGHDVQRLREIAGLTDTGVNIAGIKMVLQLQEENQRLQAQVHQLRARLEQQVRKQTKNPAPET